jgi:hypothetical protein
LEDLYRRMEEPKTTNKWENPIFETNIGDPLDFE